MEKQIKNLQDYFKRKILKGDFEVKEFKEQYIVIIVDSKYIFNLWVANGYKHFDLWTMNTFSPNFILFDFTEDEKKICYSNLEQIIIVEKNKSIIESKKKVIEEANNVIEKLSKEL